MLNSRERFARAMAHQATHRPPFDLGATTLTSMSPGCQAALRQFLGFSGAPQSTNSGVDERILDWAGTDFRGVGSIVSLPSTLARQLSSTAGVDCWGVRREQIGKYWEITGPPLRGATCADLQTFPWPEPRLDEARLAQWQEQARALHAAGRFVVVAEHPVFGILELGCWMCGYDDFLMRLAGDRPFVQAFFAKVFALQMAIIEPYYRALGPYIDLTTSGDDFGMQTGPLLSPRQFSELVAPWFTARIARTKELAHCRYWHHSCGSVVALLDLLIGCGVDILNPVQTSAAGMNPRDLKARAGKRLAFWGAMDVQHFLRVASPAAVRDAVQELVATLGADGGYIMAPAHNLQDDIPPANVVAWVEAVRALGAD